MASNTNKVLFVALPCYNEQDDIESLVDRWLALDGKLANKGYCLVVNCIDDKSTDNTNAVIRNLQQNNPSKVVLVEHEVNKGLGGALTTAFTNFAQECKNGDLLVIMDGDDTHDPVYSLDMLPLIESGCDCVIASRYCDGSQTQGVSPIRLLMSDGARVFYSLVLRVKGVKDYTCGYRMYTYPLVSESLKTYGSDLVERKTFACMMEVLYKMSLLGASFGEVPFHLRYDRKQGDSKMRVLKTALDSVGTALSLRWSLRKRRRAKSDALLAAQ